MEVTDLLPRGNRGAFLATVVVLLTGCVTRVPQALTAGDIPKAFVEQAPGSQPAWPSAEWWRSFGSEELSDFIMAAQANNRDLAVAMARVEEAGARMVISRAALFPQITTQAASERAGADSASAGGGSSSISSPGGGNSAGNTFALSVAASYSLDVWGLGLANLRSAREALKSARFAQQAAALRITAGVAGAYLNVLALRERMAIAKEDISAINSILDVVKLKVTTGTSSSLDLAQETAQVESVEAQLPALQEQELEARLSLAVLLGVPPEGLQVMAQNADAIAPPAVTPGLPSDLLLRRPDVAAAEAALASAHANLDAARAAFLPQFSLTGSAGYSGAAASGLLSPSSFVWRSGASLLQAIFAGGELVGQKKLAYATQKELVATYQSAVLVAFTDVESALGQVSMSAQSEARLRHVVEAAQQAFQISELQYRQGANSLLGVLQAQQTLFGARDQLAQTKMTRLQAIVHLYAALGGGWLEPMPDRTQSVTPAPAAARR